MKPPSVFPDKIIYAFLGVPLVPVHINSRPEQIKRAAFSLFLYLSAYVNCHKIPGSNGNNIKKIPQSPKYPKWWKLSQIEIPTWEEEKNSSSHYQVPFCVYFVVDFTRSFSFYHSHHCSSFSFVRQNYHLSVCHSLKNRGSTQSRNDKVKMSINLRLELQKNLNFFSKTIHYC